MSRFFAEISSVDLRNKCIDATNEDEEANYVDVRVLKDKLAKDMKVDFDTENTSFGASDRVGPNGLMGLVSLGNGFTFWGMCAGGDWEHPVYWIVYWDGKKLRAYVPTNGNPWNTDTKQAFGNNDAMDLKNAKKRWPEEFKNSTEEDMDGAFDFDSGLILNDILERIEAKK